MDTKDVKTVVLIITGKGDAPPDVIVRHIAASDVDNIKEHLDELRAL